MEKNYEERVGNEWLLETHVRADRVER